METTIESFFEHEPTSGLQRFADDVRRGLSGNPKSIPSFYFYDRAGSRLFEKICEQPEYYCTRAETEILERHARYIVEQCPDPVQIVELGSGSSIKTRVLLEAFVDAQTRTTYVPIDISREILAESAAELDRLFPPLAVKPVVASYEIGMDSVNPADGSVLLVWLGSSIGNFERDAAKKFLSRLRLRLSPGDGLLLGVDLIKDSTLLEAAYNDRAGVTAEFNRNLLVRINRELGGTFNHEKFGHRAIYNPREERIEMYLVSLRPQQVYIGALDMTFAFQEGERIHTENSYKYHADEIAALAGEFGVDDLRQWFDSGRLFSLNLFQV